MDEHRAAQVERYLQLFPRETGRHALELQGHLGHVSPKDGQELHGSNIVTEAVGQIDRFAEEFFPRMFPGCLVIQEETADQVMNLKNIIG